jgi:site-specific DNA recombinase
MKTMGMYARVSSGRQEEERTIESQVAAIECRVAEMDAVLDPEHRYLDDGWSGETLRRPALDQLRDAVAQNRLDCVILYDADRLARRFVDQQVVLEEFAGKGVEVVFVHGGVARTDEERMALAMRGVFAEYERAKILDRTRRGNLHRARSGAPPGWPNPAYGYRYVPGARHQPGTVVIEECEAHVVRRIFSWVGVEGLRLRQVAQRLEERGIASRNGHRWSTSTLGQIVRNTAYVGRAHHQKYEAVEPQRPRNPHGYRRRRKSSTRLRPREQWISTSVPAIIDPELFEKAQQRLHENRRRTAGQAKHPYLLRGLLICSACGRPLWGRIYDPGQRTERRYYTCNRRDRFSARDTTPCPRRALRAEDVEQVVWQDLERWLQEPEQLTAQLEAQRDKVRTMLEAYDGEHRRLVRRTKAIEGEISRLVDAYQAGAITLDELRGRRDRLEEGKQQCEASLAKWQNDQRQALHQRQVVDELQQLKEQLREGLQRCGWEDRRAIVQLLVEKIEVTEHKLQVHYVVPLDAHPSGADGHGRTGELKGGTGERNGGLCRPCPRGRTIARGSTGASSRRGCRASRVSWAPPARSARSSCPRGSRSARARSRARPRRSASRAAPPPARRPCRARDGAPSVAPARGL